MSWGKPKVPNTISDKKMAALQKRASKASRGMFDAKTVRQRKASEKQRRNSFWS
jgi:hypothetical protein